MSINFWTEHKPPIVSKTQTAGLPSHWKVCIYSYLNKAKGFALLNVKMQLAWKQKFCQKKKKVRFWDLVKLSLRIKVEPFQSYVKVQEAAPMCWPARTYSFHRTWEQWMWAEGETSGQGNRTDLLASWWCFSRSNSTLNQINKLSWKRSVSVRICFCSESRLFPYWIGEGSQCPKHLSWILYK